MRTSGSFILKISKLLAPKVINKIEYLPIDQAQKALLAEFLRQFFSIFSHDDTFSGYT
jgi:hypothetical protein